MFRLKNEVGHKEIVAQLQLCKDLYLLYTGNIIRGPARKESFM